MLKLFIICFSVIFVVIGSFFLFASMPRVMIPHSLIHHFEDIKTDVLTFPSELKVMSYNMAYAGGLLNEEGRSESRDVIEKNLDSIVDLIKKENPDVLAVQEIDIYSRRSFGINELDFIAEECGYPYAAVAITWNKRWVPHPIGFNFKKQFGFVLAAQVVFSKYPISSHRVTPLIKPINRPFWYNWFYLDRLFQKVVIGVADRKISFGHVHLEAFDKETRLSQVGMLLDNKKINLDNIDILLGDLNTIHPDWSHRTTFEDEPDISFEGDDSIDRILKESGLTEVFSGKRNSSNRSDFFTFPSNQPNRQLDYIFLNEDTVTMKDSAVLQSSGDASDHCPVILTLSL